MDQAQLLSLIGSLYDKLVADVATRVQSQLNLGTVTDIINESIDARVKAVVEDDFSNLFNRVTCLEDRGPGFVTEDALDDLIQAWVENNLDLDDQIENWVENNLDLEEAAREAVGNLDLGDSVREIIKNDLTFSVSVD